MSEQISKERLKESRTDIPAASIQEVGSLPPADYERLSNYWMERTRAAEVEILALRTAAEGMEIALVNANHSFPCPLYADALAAYGKVVGK